MIDSILNIVDSVRLPFSKAYRQGLEAGVKGKNEIHNPYADAATDHNLEHGMGASPWWNTKYQPFLDWQMGLFDAKATFDREAD